MLVFLFFISEPVVRFDFNGYTIRKPLKYIDIERGKNETQGKEHTSMNERCSLVRTCVFLPLCLVFCALYIEMSYQLGLFVLFSTLKYI